MQRLVQALEVRERPDIVLIDSRAGLHDLAAISIAALADLALLFATDSEQHWQGYRPLRRLAAATRSAAWCPRTAMDGAGNVSQTEQKARF